jgi:hypothetical protein
LACGRDDNGAALFLPPHSIKKQLPGRCEICADTHQQPHLACKFAAPVLYFICIELVFIFCCRACVCVSHSHFWGAKHDMLLSDVAAHFGKLTWCGDQSCRATHDAAFYLWQLHDSVKMDDFLPCFLVP